MESVFNILEQLAQSKKMPGADHIFVAGEKEYSIMLDREKKGVPVPEATQLQLLQMIEELKLDPKKYEIEWGVKYDGSVDCQGW